MHVVVTGGSGFIGSHFVRYLLASYPSIRITNIDKLTYAAHPDTTDELSRLAPSQYEMVRCDIASPELRNVLSRRPVDAIVNIAAETHVDRSILEPGAFVRTNVLGVQNLLDCARDLGGIRVVHVSTDEVYGALTPNAAAFTELSPLDPNSPYAASKAAADLLALANHRTYGQPVVITRCSNCYGPYQFPEKLIPLVIANALDDVPIPVYGDGKQVRDWIYVEDHCRAIAQVMEEGRVGEVYNISAEKELTNLILVETLLALLGKDKRLIKHVGDRPAHDRRYALNSSKMRTELEWAPKTEFREGLARTVEWYLGHKDWWRKVRDKDYFSYYQNNYQKKFETGASVGGSV